MKNLLLGGASEDMADSAAVAAKLKALFGTKTSQRLVRRQLVSILSLSSVV